MKCPFCKHDDTKVTDSRATDDGRAIRRRRECQSCGRRFTTYEMVEESPLIVIKRNGSRELFDRSKILNGLLRASNKRMITRQQLEDIVSHVERDIRNSLAQEVTSEKIGEMVLDDSSLSMKSPISASRRYTGNLPIWKALWPSWSI